VRPRGTQPKQPDLWGRCLGVARQSSSMIEALHETLLPSEQASQAEIREVRLTLDEFCPYSPIVDPPVVVGGQRSASIALDVNCRCPLRTSAVAGSGAGKWPSVASFGAQTGDFTRESWRADWDSNPGHED
jgi:hypothetical protein